MVSISKPLEIVCLLLWKKGLLHFLLIALFALISRQDFGDIGDSLVVFPYEMERVCPMLAKSITPSLTC
jgi:hypothetical protein